LIEKEKAAVESALKDY